MDVSELKKMAAEKAVEGIQSGMAVGLGTGSTAFFVVEAVARRIREGILTDIVAVPTSVRTEEHARKVGIRLTTFESHPTLDITIDGADEVDPGLNLVKGLGGALFREKIVAAASKKFIVVADESKQVKLLGTKAPLPVEVSPFGWEVLPAKLEKLGAKPVLRKADTGKAYVTDGGNFILDCRFNGISNPAELERGLKSVVGVIETGLFIGMASEVIIAAEGGVKVLKRS